MKKKLCIFIACLLGFTCFCSCKKDDKELEYKIESAELEIEKIEDKIEKKTDEKGEVEEKIEKLNEEWDKQVIYFKLFTDHASFEALEKKIKKLPYVSEENYGTICAEIIFDIVLLKEHISFSPSNIF